MGKRKREVGEQVLDSKRPFEHSGNGIDKSKKAYTTLPQPFSIQVIAGTYEKILHGITAVVNINADSANSANQKDNAAVEFADTFLFNAHGSAIRCLALSPPSKQGKITLVSGSSDQTINLYQLSARKSGTKSVQSSPLSSFVGRKIVEDSENKELGSLQHHSANVNALKFPTRSKLLSAADDNTVAITRTRDWTVLSTIKIPIPKAHGRPSGDTAPLGGTPAGVNDFAIHPSMKLMVSVSKGEKCMRLWNLVTGRKAGVLNFEKAPLQAVGEGRWGRGEGYRVEWNSDGEEFAITFEKGVIIFGLVSFAPDLNFTTDFTVQDARPKGIITTVPQSKIHQCHYINHVFNEQTRSNILAVSTEDGRIVFFCTSQPLRQTAESSDEIHPLPRCQPIGEISGEGSGLRNRVKDFEVLRVPDVENFPYLFLVVTCGSEGSIRVWKTDLSVAIERLQSSTSSKGVNGNTGDAKQPEEVSQIGQLLGEYETGNRITCIKAFIMADMSESTDVPRSPLENVADTNGVTGIRD